MAYEGASFFGNTNQDVSVEQAASPFFEKHKPKYSNKVMDIFWGMIQLPGNSEGCDLNEMSYG